MRKSIKTNTLPLVLFPSMEKIYFLGLCILKFWYIILSLMDALSTYGKLFDETSIASQTPEQNFLGNCFRSHRTWCTVGILFCFVFFLTSNTIGSVTWRPCSACQAVVGYSVLTEMAAVQDKPVTPHSSAPEFSPRFLFLVCSSLLHHMTLLSHRVLWENRGYGCAPFKSEYPHWKPCFH